MLPPTRGRWGTGSDRTHEKMRECCETGYQSPSRRCPRGLFKRVYAIANRNHLCGTMGLSPWQCKEQTQAASSARSGSAPGSLQQRSAETGVAQVGLDGIGCRGDAPTSPEAFCLDRESDCTIKPRLQAAPRQFLWVLRSQPACR